MLVCESHEGAADDAIINLDTIHAFHNGRCYEASGPATNIAAAVEWLKAKNTEAHKGQCKRKVDECKDWGGLKVCRTGHGSDEETNLFALHAWHKGYCLEVRGARVAVEDAAKGAPKGINVEKGPCHGKVLKEKTENGLRWSIHA